MFSRAAVFAGIFLVIAYIAMISLSVVEWRREPRVGVEASPSSEGHMTITYVMPGGVADAAGARIGDTLLEIDGVAIGEPDWQRRGDTGSSLKVGRPGDTGPVVKYAKIKSLSDAYAIILWIISLTFALTSFFIAWRTGGSDHVAIASILLMVGAIAFAVAPASTHGIWWANLSNAVSHQSAAALFFIFFAMFPTEIKGRLPSAGPLIYGMAAAAVVLHVLYFLILLPGSDLSIISLQVIRPIQGVFLAAGFLGGLAYLVNAYVASRSPVLKEQLRIMSAGMVAAIAPFMVLAVVPAAFGSREPPGAELAAPFLVLVPLSFTYAIMRHRLMGIRRLVHKGAAYGLITALIVVSYIAIVGLLSRVADPVVSESLAVQLVIMMILSAGLFLMSTTRRLAVALVDRTLHKEYVDHAELARRFSLAVASVTRLDELAGSALGEVASDLRLSFVVFVSVTGGQGLVRARTGQVSESLLGLAESVVSSDRNGSVSMVELNSGPDSGEVLVAHVKAPPPEAWLLCLGPKVNEEPFLKEDLRLAESLASSIAIVIEKLELLEMLETKTLELKELNRRLVNTQEAERTRIASYLHDEVLRDVSNLVWRYGDNNGSSGLRQELSRIADTIRNFAANLHPAVLEDLGLVRAFEWLAGEATARNEFHVSYEPGNVWRNDRLGPDIELALYRIAQEALTNCGRHGKATTVWLRLSRSEDHVTLTVDDDGVGFAPNVSFQPNARLGLIGMRERAEQVGGEFEVLRRGGGGTRVVATLPIGREEVSTASKQENRT